MASHGFGLCPRMPAHWPVVTRFYMFLLFISSWVRILKKNQTVLTISSIKWQLYLGTLPAERKALSRIETVGKRDRGVRRSQAPLGRLLTPVPDTQTLPVTILAPGLERCLKDRVGSVGLTKHRASCRDSMWWHSQKREPVLRQLRGQLARRAGPPALTRPLRCLLWGC